MKYLFYLLVLFVSVNISAQVWIPDHGNGKFSNPVIHADYSDPDVIRVGSTYYMTSSSFSHFPGLPILQSKDLVNWEIIAHAVDKYPIDSFSLPQHGCGIWAPSIRYHKNEFYIYFGDPDHGIFMTKAKNPKGPWSPLHLVKKAKGWIDPCPLWDEDGNAYLVHAWAKSRSGIKSILTINKMSPDGRTILDEGKIVFNDSIKHPSIEGPKFYKRNGYYYIFAPAGGVKTGWQTVLRSKSIYGPYEDKIVLEQGETDVNGPHQGACIETPKGESWFIHFQDKNAYGRIVHLQPFNWICDWPQFSNDINKNGIGEPLNESVKPDSMLCKTVNPKTDDDFNSSKLSLQWQWQANYNKQWYSLTKSKGHLRLFAQHWPKEENLYNAPFLLMQKFPALAFSADIKLSFNNKNSMIGDKAGLIIFGSDYSYIALQKTKTGFSLTLSKCIKADKNNKEEIISDIPMSPEVFLRVEVLPGAVCSFLYSLDGIHFKALGKSFTAQPGRWVGAKIGLFSVTHDKSSKGYADFDYIKFSEYPWR